MTEQQSAMSNMQKNKLTIHPFDPSLVVVNKKGLADYNKVAEKIVVEKAKSSENITKSEIIAYVEDTDPLKAGEQLMSVIKNSVAKDMQGKSADKNKVTIKLGSNVEIASTLDTNPNYQPTKDNTTLDLNDYTLKIHKLAVFQKNVTVEDKSTSKSGKIILNSDKTNNGEITIYENGNFSPNVDLSKLANQEVDKEE